MKKKTILLSILLGMTALLLFTNTNVAAAPPTWIGVSEGESYSWFLTINIDGLQEMATETQMDTGLEDLDDMLGAFGGDFPGLKLGITIDTISDLINGPYFDYVEVNCSPSVSIPDVTSLDLGALGMVMTVIVLDPDTVNWTINTFMLFMNMTSLDENATAIPIPLLIVPTTVNWTEEAQVLNDLLVSMGMPVGALTISAIEGGYGLKATIGAGSINVTQTKDIVYKMSYNEKGVLGQASVSYGSTTVMSIGPEPPDAIPGFEIPIIIGVSSLAIIGTIFYIKKRKIKV